MGFLGAHPPAVFQHTAARRRLAIAARPKHPTWCFNTQPPEGGWSSSTKPSTCSRCFNTQPPEGGWGPKPPAPPSRLMFQHTAARRRLVAFGIQLVAIDFVSTHSRPKAAGGGRCRQTRRARVSTHSRPKAAGIAVKVGHAVGHVSTHSRPKAAGRAGYEFERLCRCFNTQPPEGGWFKPCGGISSYGRFNTQPREGGWISIKPVGRKIYVSTHSRPKAAGGDRDSRA